MAKPACALNVEEVVQMCASRECCWRNGTHGRQCAPCLIPPSSFSRYFRLLAVKRGVVVAERFSRGGRPTTISSEASLSAGLCDAGYSVCLISHRTFFVYVSFGLFDVMPFRAPDCYIHDSVRIWNPVFVEGFQGIRY